MPLLLPGRQVIEGITRLLGDNIWASTFIGLTHGRLTSLPDNLTYGGALLLPAAPGSPSEWMRCDRALLIEGRSLAFVPAPLSPVPRRCTCI